MSINYRGSVLFAHKCKSAGVKRFVYASSCSIYGSQGGDQKTETSATDPQTAYARCKVLVEHEVRALADAQFTPVFLRNATAYGASPRQRFDVVLNNLAGFAFTTGEIRVMSDGTPWRPLVHVEDICEAILCALEAPREAVSGEAFNVGSDAQNYRVREIAEIVAATFPGCRATFGAPAGRRIYPQQLLLRPQARHPARHQLPNASLHRAAAVALHSRRDLRRNRRLAARFADQVGVGGIRSV
jgi:nucleoside-diphosphate-sugar epimerase